MKKTMLVCAFLLLSIMAFGLKVTFEEGTKNYTPVYKISVDEPVTSMKVSVKIITFGKEIILENIFFAPSYEKDKGTNSFFHFYTKRGSLEVGGFENKEGFIAFDEIEEIISYTVEEAKFFDYTYDEINVNM